MPKVQVALTANLQTYYPKPRFEMEADTIRQLLQKMDEVRPLFSTYILEDSIRIRRHVNIFINGDLLKDKAAVDTRLQEGAQVHIMQALSGG